MVSRGPHCYWDNSAGTTTLLARAIMAPSLRPLTRTERFP